MNPNFPPEHSQASAYPVIMTIAGTDSGGGAGVQADLKTITVLGAYGASVLAALTAQNGAGVLGIHEVPVDFMLLQLKAVREGFPVRAAKTGMLASSDIIEALAEALVDKNFPLVVDPVCVSQSGHRLLKQDAEAAMRDHMLPLADLLTPNRPEAALLAGIPVVSEKDVPKAAEKLFKLGAGAVLLKGGHFSDFEGKNTMVDWLCLPGKQPKAMPHPRVETVNNHGTGCTLSAAIATYLGMGCELEKAVAQAQAYLSRALATSFSPGIGAGPPNFLGGR
ncbi:bifunctional hydroxymethylpyrimidine kinase/phosphomethylpyrimidine kinase [Desulfovibrio sp. OttesenSCG-928-F20]|nr:bifunctional hydroxymethylpyrimidine kinase/phosphomethylpyrimidine kinase [Desulfovibrio sp. OttesenSCG-928-F20]